MQGFRIKYLFKVQNIKCVFYTYLFFLFLFGCSSHLEKEREEWINDPVSAWPYIALTNRISFTDTTYNNMANAFLLNTGYDTLAITCKHIFYVFDNDKISAIDLGSDFLRWKMYPKGNEEQFVELDDLVNADYEELIDEYNLMKVKDWLVFTIKNKSDSIVPLMLRSRPVEKDEIIYNVGWAYHQYTKSPSLIKMKVYNNLGPYFYTKTLTENVDAPGRSGSMVIDKNGHLVGIVSGAEGNLGVICSINYLLRTLDKYDITYKELCK